MARVDFYVLTQVDERARQMLACKLAEKAWRLDNTVYIHASSREDAERLDQLLWTFRDGSFVPHGLAGRNDGTESSPIMIGADDDGVGPRDLLINLCDEIPSFAEGFPRVAELVTSDESCRLASRKRYATYRDQGHELNTHKL
ncbi:MAG: DNA polymerase III subunit chi [Gammaproteobacteria bacterium]|jgi:DNA polymerase-3 subunit chi|nr:DNA polymerase III subunit chi [Gammaproteobacteria bacterium]